MKGNSLVLQGEFKKADKCLRIELGKEKTDQQIRSQIMNNLAVNWWKNGESTEKVMPLLQESLQDPDLIPDDGYIKDSPLLQNAQVATQLLNICEFNAEAKDNSFWIKLTLKYLEH